MTDKTFVLWQDHIHAGKKYKAGETITLPQDAYEWLLNATKAARGELNKELEKIQGTPQWLERFESARPSKKSKSEEPKE